MDAILPSQHYLSFSTRIFSSTVASKFQFDRKAKIEPSIQLHYRLGHALIFPSQKQRRGIQFASSLPRGVPGDTEGDENLQNKLVEMVRLQKDTMIVNDFVEMKAKHMTELVQQADEEYKRIAEVALQGLEEAGEKVLQKIDADVHDFEKQLALDRLEIDQQDRNLAELEKRIEESRSRGLFFKSLYSSSKPWKQQTPEKQAAILEEVEKVKSTAVKAANSNARRWLYSVLIILLMLTLIQAASTGNFRWPVNVLYPGLLAAMILQMAVEGTRGNP